MCTEPDWKTWSDEFLQELYYTPSDQRATLVEAHLKRAEARGYTRGCEHGWVDTLESDMIYQRLNDRRGTIPYDIDKED